MRAVEMEPVPRCRILMRDGMACDEVITARPRRDDFWGDEVEPAEPRAGFGTSRKRKPEITRARVAELRAAGKTVKQIAAALKCTPQTVYNRLHVGR